MVLPGLVELVVERRAVRTRVLVVRAVIYFIFSPGKPAATFLQLRTRDIRRRHTVKCSVHDNMISAMAAGYLLFFQRH